LKIEIGTAVIDSAEGRRPAGCQEKTKGRFRGLRFITCDVPVMGQAGNRGSALTRLEARVALADHEHLAAATHDFAIAMTLLGGFEGRKDFHGGFP